MAFTPPTAPTPGAAASGRPVTGPRARLRTGFGLLGPRHPRHTLSMAQVDTLGLPVGDDGVVVGVNGEGQPAVLG